MIKKGGGVSLVDRLREHGITAVHDLSQIKAVGDLMYSFAFDRQHATSRRVRLTIRVDGPPLDLWTDDLPVIVPLTITDAEMVRVVYQVPGVGIVALWRCDALHTRDT